MKISDARQDEIEIDEPLDFAESLLVNAAGTWKRGSLELRATGSISSGRELCRWFLSNHCN
jgi:hypothetical protein